MILDFIQMNDHKIEKHVSKTIISSEDPECIAVLKSKINNRLFALYSSKYFSSKKNKPEVALNISSVADLSVSPIVGSRRTIDYREIDSKHKCLENNPFSIKEIRKTSNWFNCSDEIEMAENNLHLSKQDEILQQMNELIQKTEMVD